MDRFTYLMYEYSVYSYAQGLQYWSFLVNHCQTTSKKKEVPFNILFVDDDTRYLRMIKFFIDNILDDDGRQAVYAESAEQALAEIRKRPFNLLFTDLNMGNMDGIELARKARNLMSEISTILVTGGPVSLEVMENAEDAGISKIIAKPFNLNILREIIETEQKKYAGGLS